VRGGNQDQRIPIVNWADRIDPNNLVADFRGEFGKKILAEEDHRQ
jgi:hypothetical protein